MVVYKEFDYIFYNDSKHVVQYFSSLHKNIKVVKHPDVYISYWSHHEKLVVIDQKLGFLGGMDLSFGRYETDNYDLFEPKKDKT